MYLILAKICSIVTPEPTSWEWKVLKENCWPRVNPWYDLLSQHFNKRYNSLNNLKVRLIHSGNSCLKRLQLK